MSNFINEEEDVQLSSSTSKSFSRWVKFLVRPSKAGFESIRDIASTPHTLIGLTIAWELQTAIGMVVGIQDKILSTFMWSPVLNIIFFYLSQVAIWIGSKILGGKGKFIEQSNLIALTAIPVTIVDGIFDLVRLTPLYEDAAMFLQIRIIFKLYYLVTIALGLQVTHNLSATKAWTVAIILGVFYASFTALLALLFYAN